MIQYEVTVGEYVATATTGEEVFAPTYAECEKRLKEANESCPLCGGTIETEDYLNPCASAACKLNGVHTYHLGCGSQHRDVCIDCGEVLYDSAEDEIENAEWEAVEYICRQCEAEGIQPGHFACGETYWIPSR